MAKRKNPVSNPKPDPKRSKKEEESSAGLLSVEEITRMETEILASPKNYNSLVLLIEALDQDESDITVALISSLFKIFGKLLKKNQLRAFPSMTAAQQKVTAWLGDRYTEFKQLLFKTLKTSKNDTLQALVIQIVFRIAKIENSHYALDEIFFPKALLLDTFEALLFADPASHVDTAIEQAMDSYIIEYDDIRYYFMNLVDDLLVDLLVEKKKLEDPADSEFKATAAVASVRLFDMLSKISSLFPDSDDQINSFYLEIPKKYVNPTRLISSPLRLSSHKTVFQKCWVSAFKLPVSYDQYKDILQILHKTIIPNMIQPQMLLDFLTNAYDAGGPISILALNGLFSLMQKYNLEYPNFYTKLYELFDASILHVKYRSRFLRLVDLFLSSTHTAANVIASFIKKLSRLALYAPPAAIVAVVPFIYNLLKKHPSCMAMIQRPDYTLSADGFQDLFDDTEKDPLLTNAIDSSLWELQTLQTHYHPNVATLARIISEQFTKENYNMEDFLDMSYGTLMQAEQKRRLKAPPALEFESFDKVFETDDQQDSGVSAFMVGWAF